MLDRRDFLRKIVVLVPVSIAACAPFSPLRRSSGKTFQAKYFTHEECAFIIAASERIVPTDENGPGAAELGAIEFMDREMDGPFGHGATWYMQGPFAMGAPELGYQLPFTPRELYRTGIAAVNDYCIRSFNGKSFSELSAESQDNILGSLETGVIDLERVSGKAFFDLLLQNIQESYLADPMHGGNKNMESWKMIGFPGARADFIDYIDKYGERYPLGPVGIADGKSGCNE